MGNSPLPIKTFRNEEVYVHKDPSFKFALLLYSTSDAVECAKVATFS